MALHDGCECCLGDVWLPGKEAFEQDTVRQARKRSDLKQRLELRRRTRQLSPPAAAGAPIPVSPTSPESASRGNGMLHFFPGATLKKRGEASTEDDLHGISRPRQAD